MIFLTLFVTIASAVEFISGVTECTVCLNKINDEDRVSLGCNHSYHRECLDNWRQIRSTCPLCREPILPSILLTVNRSAETLARFESFSEPVVGSSLFPEGEACFPKDMLRFWAVEAQVFLTLIDKGSASLSIENGLCVLETGLYKPLDLISPGQTCVLYPQREEIPVEISVTCNKELKYNISIVRSDGVQWSRDFKFPAVATQKARNFLKNAPQPSLFSDLSVADKCLITLTSVAFFVFFAYLAILRRKRPLSARRDIVTV